MGLINIYVLCALVFFFFFLLSSNANHYGITSHRCIACLRICGSHSFPGSHGIHGSLGITGFRCIKGLRGTYRSCGIGSRPSLRLGIYERLWFDGGHLYPQHRILDIHQVILAGETAAAREKNRLGHPHRSKVLGLVRLLRITAFP